MTTGQRAISQVPVDFGAQVVMGSPAMLVFGEANRSADHGVENQVTEPFIEPSPAHSRCGCRIG